MREHEIPAELREKIENWMNNSRKQYDYGSAFDLAVDAAHDLEIVKEEQEYEIPVYVVEIAERLMGKD